MKMLFRFRSIGFLVLLLLGACSARVLAENGDPPDDAVAPDKPLLDGSSPVSLEITKESTHSGATIGAKKGEAIRFEAIRPKCNKDLWASGSTRVGLDIGGCKLDLAWSEEKFSVNGVTIEHHGSSVSVEVDGSTARFGPSSARCNGAVNFGDSGEGETAKVDISANDKSGSGKRGECGVALEFSDRSYVPTTTTAIPEPQPSASGGANHGGEEGKGKDPGNAGQSTTEKAKVGGMGVGAWVGIGIGIIVIAVIAIVAIAVLIYFCACRGRRTSPLPTTQTTTNVPPTDVVVDQPDASNAKRSVATAKKRSGGLESAAVAGDSLNKKNIESKEPLVSQSGVQRGDDMPEPRVFTLDDQQKRIAAGARAGRNEYPTMDDVKSNWDPTTLTADAQETKKTEKKHPSTAKAGKQNVDDPETKKTEKKRPSADKVGKQDVDTHETNTTEKTRPSTEKTGKQKGKSKKPPATSQDSKDESEVPF